MRKGIVITGGSGFVGSNLVKCLNEKGFTNIVIVDNFGAKKSDNLKNAVFIDFIDYAEGLERTINSLEAYDINVFFHIGANADVNVPGYSSMIKDNFLTSKAYLKLATEKNADFLYASSSAVYGNSNNCHVSSECEKPHNAYAFSKLLFDNYVRYHFESFRNRVMGFRFFNIFGPGEFHKDKNASMPYRFYEFLNNDNRIDLFRDRIERDYIYVGDVTESLFRFWQSSDVNSGIYNLGTSQTISHLELAEIVLDEFVRNVKSKAKESPLIEIIDMPEGMRNVFQFYTRAMDLHPIVSSIVSDNKQQVRKYIADLCLSHS